MSVIALQAMLWNLFSMSWTVLRVQTRFQRNEAYSKIGLITDV